MQTLQTPSNNRQNSVHPAFSFSHSVSSSPCTDALLAPPAAHGVSRRSNLKALISISKTPSIRRIFILQTPPLYPTMPTTPTKTSLLIMSQSKALSSLSKTLDLILLHSSFQTRQGFGLRTREICSRESTAPWGRLATNMPLLERTSRRGRSRSLRF